MSDSKDSRLHDGGPGWPGLWVWLIMAALGAIAVATAQTNWVGDHAVTNIIAVSLGFWVLATPVIWFFFFSGHPADLRWLFAKGLLGLLLLAVLLLRVQRPTGDLLPRLRFVWQQPAEAPPLPRAEADESVDLRKATPWDFPQYCGPGRDLQVDHVRLDPDWETNPPRLLWRQPVGAGWSGFAAVNGYAVTIEQRGEQEAVTCYDAATGELKWSHAIEARHDTTMGRLGPRSTPTIADGRVYATGATGVLRALDGADGGLLWRVDLPAEFGVAPGEDGQEVAWGRANSPLLVDGMVVVPAGGPQGGPLHSLAAFDAESGRRLWTGGDDQISYSSPALMTLAGVRQIVSVNENTVSGHRVADGRLLWTLPWAGSSSGPANTSQPMQIDDASLLVSKGYSRGAARIRVTAAETDEDGSTRLEAEFQWQATKVLKTKLTSAIVHQGHAYGLNDGILQCVDLNDEGRSEWKAERLKHGQPLLAGDLLLVMAEWGDLRLYRASPQRPEKLGVLEDAVNGTAWNTLCLHGRRLLVRSDQEAACYELAGELVPPRPAPPQEQQDDR